MKLMAVVEAASVTGAAKNLLDFAQRARKLPKEQRVETSIVTFQHDRHRGPNLFLEALEQAEIPAFCIRQSSVTDSKTLVRLRAAFEEFAPDALETHGVKSHFLMRLSGLPRLRPWNAFFHGYTTTDFKMRVYNQFDRWSLRTPDSVVTVSDAFARLLAQRGVPPQRITVIHSDIDPLWMTRGADPAGLRKQLGLSPEERVIISVGRLSHEKAHVDLVPALTRLRQKMPGQKFRLIIVGEGPERANIERAAQDAGLSEFVTLAGYASDPRPFYAIADVMALSSHSEGSPNALLEAMIAEVPAVATCVGGVPEIVKHEETALLVPPRQWDAMGDAIARVFADPAAARERARRAAEVARREHSPEARLTALCGLYQRLIEQKR